MLALQLADFQVAMGSSDLNGLSKKKKSQLTEKEAVFEIEVENKG